MTELNLSGTNLNDRCLEEMAKSLKEGKNNTLQILDISNNKLTIRGLNALL